MDILSPEVFVYSEI